VTLKTTMNEASRLTAPRGVTFAALLAALALLGCDEEDAPTTDGGGGMDSGAMGTDAGEGAVDAGGGEDSGSPGLTGPLRQCARACPGGQDDCMTRSGVRCVDGYCVRFECSSSDSCLTAPNTTCVTIQGAQICRDGCETTADCPDGQECAPDDDGTLYCRGTCENVACGGLERMGPLCHPQSGACGCDDDAQCTDEGYTCIDVAAARG